MPPDLSTLLPRIKLSEGWRERAYMDTTGNVTIGYGFNIGRVAVPLGVDVRLEPVTALPQPLGEAWLTHLVLDVIERLNFALPWVKSLDDVRQGVLVEMSYNLGVPGLMRWPIFLGQVQRGEYLAAAGNMRSSLWAHQVGQRAQRLAGMMASGRE